ncbi:MAG: DUF3160 domain-containing protein, partial [Fibrobacterota bacterium]|nr:DUF3160 domain-containing protein [Chitinispirillaceae bacterium]
AFLEQSSTLTDVTLLEQKKPANPYFSSIGSQNSNFLYLDSIKLKYKLTDSELTLLGKNNFVVSERMSFQTYASAFKDVFCKDMPVFLSSDAVLGTFHQSYDEVLIDVETKMLKPLVNEIVNDMRTAFPTVAAKYASVPENVADIDLYLTVAAILSKNSNVTSTFAAAADIKAVTDAITSEQFISMKLFSDLSRDLDFSQFTVRGHYVKANLGDYFKTLMWLGRTEFVMASPLDTVDSLTLKDLKRMSIDALILNEVLEQSGAKEKLAQMDSLLSVLVGESDNLTPSELKSITGKTSITDVSRLLEDSTYNRFAHILKTSPEAQQMILSQVIYDCALSNNPDSVKYPVSFLLLGQRFLVDSYIFGSVVYNKVPKTSQGRLRMMPDPLDAMYALGNNDALPLLKNDLQKYEYTKYLEKMRYLIDSYEPSFWSGSLYNTTLNALKNLNPQAYPPVEKQPLFMRSAAWHQQKLNTQLVAWSQLRHDNILYGKQSYTVAVSCSYPHGYVEPYPELYKVLGNFAKDAASRFGALQNGSKYATFYSGVASLMDTIGSLAVKELDGTQFSKTDSAFMSRMIAIPASKMCGGPSIEGWYTRLLFSRLVMDNGDFTIADVHTQPTDEFGNMVGKVLHTAVGNVNLGVFLANSPSASNQPMAFMGPVSSFYQDTTVDFKRVTDEEWSYIAVGASKNTFISPLRPDWVYSYLADSSGNAFGQGRILDGIPYVPSAVNHRIVAAGKGLRVSQLLNGRGIQVVLDRPSEITIAVFDTRGRVVQNNAKKVYTSGTHSLPLTAAAGIYTLKVRCGAEVHSMPLTVVK